MGKQRSEDKLPANVARSFEVPAFMADVVDGGLEDLSKYVIPPRIKIVQKQSGGVFEERFQPGDAVLVPQLVKVADPTTRLKIAPIFFFPEWVVWNPIQTRGSMPAVRERTHDPKSPLAAASKNPDKWFSDCPENPEYKCRTVEHLNFVALILDNPVVAATAVVLTFARGEHRTGSNFAALIKMRRAPIYGCQFVLGVSQRSNNKGSWYGFDAMNPDDEDGITPFVNSEDQFKAHQKLFEEFKKAHEESKIRVDYEDEDAANLAEEQDLEC